MKLEVGGSAAVAVAVGVGDRSQVTEWGTGGLKYFDDVELMNVAD